MKVAAVLLSAAGLAAAVPQVTTVWVTSTAYAQPTQPAQYQQCGGANYRGNTQCQQGLRCVAVDSNYSICQYPGGTVTSTVVVTNTQRGGGTTQAPAPPNPNGWSNWGEQCHGQAWKGPTRCGNGLVCVILDQWYGQCLYPGQTIKPE